jgi:hypothetical protein
MRALKIAGIVILAIWMAFTSWRLEYAIRTAEAACNVALVAGMNNSNRTAKSGLPCPMVVIDYMDDKKVTAP